VPFERPNDNGVFRNPEKINGRIIGRSQKKSFGCPTPTKPRTIATRIDRIPSAAIRATISVRPSGLRDARCTSLFNASNFLGEKRPPRSSHQSECQKPDCFISHRNPPSWLGDSRTAWDLALVGSKRVGGPTIRIDSKDLRPLQPCWTSATTIDSGALEKRMVESKKVVADVVVGPLGGHALVLFGAWLVY